MFSAFRPLALAIAAIFVYSCFVHAGEAVKNDDFENARLAEKSFFDLQGALKDGKSALAWQLLAEKVRFSFNNDFKFFERHYRNRLARLAAAEVRVKKVESVGEGMIALVFFEDSDSVYMRQEERLWKFYGYISTEINRANMTMGRLKSCLERYRDNYGAFPENLDMLVPNFIKELSRDPFSLPEKPYRYINERTGCQVYSFGPDRDDDKGLISYDRSRGLVSDGDLIRRVSLQAEASKTRQ